LNRTDQQLFNASRISRIRRSAGFNQGRLL
jgi:hypothetical protein